MIRSMNENSPKVKVEKTSLFKDCGLHLIAKKLGHDLASRWSSLLPNHILTP